MTAAAVELAASAGAVDLAGRTDLADLASVLRGAEAVVVGNTGPAHLAAAVGTPVVSLFAPVVPAERWHPWGVPARPARRPGRRLPRHPLAGLPDAGPPVPLDGVTAPGRGGGPGARAARAAAGGDRSSEGAS